MPAPIVNGVQPSWGSIAINMLGRTVSGVKSIDYGSTQTKENIYGAGDKPVARGQGNKEFTGSIELSEFETRAIMNALPDGDDLHDIPPFDIVVTYKPKNQNLLRTDIIRACQFASNGISSTQGDSEMSHSHELVVGDIEFNV